MITILRVIMAQSPTSILTAPRNYWDQPGGPGSVWNTPLGSGAVWGTDTDLDTSDLRHGGIINPAGQFGITIWVGGATDPIRDIQTDNGMVQLHVPANAFITGGGDGNVDLYDPINAPGKVFHVSQARLEGNTIVGTMTEVDDALSDSFGEDQETGLYGYGTAAGVITGYDMEKLAAGGHIQHMLRYATDAMYLMDAAIAGMGNQLGPNSWPQLYEDWQSGINVYTGHLKAGTTIGIPITEQMPGGLTKGGQELFWTLQHYGALFRDQAGGGVHFQADQEAELSPLIDQMRQDLPTIVQYLAPLRNQHVGGQPLSSSPMNGPGARLDPGPPPLAQTSGGGTPNPDPTPEPNPTPTPSQDNTVVALGSPDAIIDRDGNAWTITPGGQVAVNGVTDTTTGRVTTLAYEKGLIWQKNADNLWWSKSAPTDRWGPDSGTATSPIPPSGNPPPNPPTDPPPNPNPTPTPSPDNTVVAIGSSKAIIDQAGNAWTITPGGQVAVNGVADNTTGRVTTLAFEKGLIWQKNLDNLWWSKAAPTDRWGPDPGTATSPIPPSDNSPPPDPGSGPGPGPEAAITFMSEQGFAASVSANTVGTIDLGGNIFNLTAPGVAAAALGTAGGTIQFAGMQSVTLRGGGGDAVVTADQGKNSWTAGSGQIDVEAGTGADAFIYHAGSGRMIIRDFAAIGGDTLTIDGGLRSSMQIAPDGQGGTMLSFAGTGGIDLKGLAGDPTTMIRWL